jgi:GTP-binding protein
MAFIDEIKIHASAGKGGDGVVRWRHEKFKPKSGPAGGDGGRGGDFYVLAIRDIGALSRYTAKKKFSAENGGNGKKDSLHGKNGEDFVLELPVGSVITDLNDEDAEKIYLNEEGQKVKLLSGGYGGFGNEHFKSSTNTTPKQANPGEKGEEGDYLIELELFADIGLVGYPSAGKSSLLNMVTKAKAKVGSYHFTTLDPNLGDFYGFIIADLPGIIEGASEGKGLGIKFLKHIKRTRMLAHLVSLENEDPILVYKGIRNELEKYDEDNQLEEEGLAKKKEIIILTKSDVLENKKEAEKKQAEFQKLYKDKQIFILSLYDDKSIKTLQEELVKILKEN